METGREPTVDELAEAMAENPRAWAEQYLDLLEQCHRLADSVERLQAAANAE